METTSLPTVAALPPLTLAELLSAAGATWEAQHAAPAFAELLEEVPSGAHPPLVALPDLLAAAGAAWLAVRG